MFEEYLQTCGHVKTSKIRLDALRGKTGSEFPPQARDEKVPAPSQRARLGSGAMHLRSLSLGRLGKRRTGGGPAEGTRGPGPVGGARGVSARLGRPPQIAQRLV